MGPKMVFSLIPIGYKPSAGSPCMSGRTSIALFILMGFALFGCLGQGQEMAPAGTQGPAPAAGAAPAQGQEIASIGSESPAAGPGAPYVPFTKAAYDEALSSGKVIYLEFYANWCPICAQQAPGIEAAFARIDDPDVVGFRVNYKDSETDADEQELARKFGVAYQHTHIIIGRDGQVAKRSGEVWDEETVYSSITEVA